MVVKSKAQTADRIFAPSEKNMWASKRQYRPLTEKLSNEEINDRYENRSDRFITEINREKLPNVVENLKKEGYLNTRPFYQRKDRWNEEQQSKLIESFLVNIPIPPVILYETKYNSYEVIDGQQRITAISDFYNNKFQLTGLDLWAELNGFMYKDLPSKIKDGIDRRSLSSIVLITESTSNSEEAMSLRRLAFERINTGGISLSKQEIRNCLYTGKFNDLLFELSQNNIFVEAWNIPVSDSKKLKANNLFKKMEDLELILRFFALRHFTDFRGDISSFLDTYMQKSTVFMDDDIKWLRKCFLDTIEMASNIYQEHLFRPFGAKKDYAYKEYYDAVMVGCSYHLSNAPKLIERREKVVEATNKLLSAPKVNKLFTGGGGTKEGIKERISLFEDMLSQVAAE
jgi:hypothetical protein